MLDNLIFSLNATMPLFLVMVVGWFLKNRGAISDEFVKVSNKLNFNVTLVCLLFLDMKDCNIKENFDGKYVLYCFVVTLVCILITWIVGRIFIKDKSIIGEFVQGSYRGSAAVLGIALIANVAGDTGMGPIMIVGAVPLYNIFAVIILAVENRKNEDRDLKNLFKQAVKGVCTNPIILSLFAGLLFSLFELDFPPIINKTLDSIASLTTPLALLCIGASFKGKAAIKMLSPTITATLIKLVVQPLVFLPVAAKMGFGTAEMAAVLIMLGAPTTPSCFIMAKNMGHEGTLTASIVALTTLLSAFTVTFWVFFMKNMGWI
ncbi:MAG: AEC family transporter [Lachnospiraceae bacterium]|nr:AEC family transporter [Lachnospiraceae bacterium]